MKFGTMHNWMPKVSSSLTRFFDPVLDLPYPQGCIVCDKRPGPYLCQDCHAFLQPLPMGTCTRCGVGSEGECPHCAWMISLDWLRSSVHYKRLGSVLVRRLKFQRHLPLASLMGEKIAQTLQDAPFFDAVLPIPIHWSRFFQRGFNQSLLLAQWVQPGKVRKDILHRIRATPPQVGLTARERRKNLKNAFRAQNCNELRLILVDDVVTTGGTLEEAATTLKSAGAAWVGAVTFARELTPNP